MKNVNFLLDRLPSIDELNDLLQNMIESSGNFVNYMMNIQDDKKLMQDTYGCERFFVDFFINDEMREDFPLIARDFYVHEFANIPKHQDVEYFDIEAGEDWPELMFNRFTLGLNKGRKKYDESEENNEDFISDCYNYIYITDRKSVV